jgi:plastocyanin
VSPKIPRLLFVASLVAGFSAPMFGAHAAGQTRTVDAYNLPRGFEVPGAPDPRRLEIDKDDTVSWIIWEGEHTVTAKVGKQWGCTGSPGRLTEDSEGYSKKFTAPGDYFYFCELHGSRDGIGKPDSMWGVIRVIDRTPNTTASTSPATTSPTPTTSTTPPTTARPGPTPPATTATVPTTRPGPIAPATTATTAKADKDKDKDKKPKDETTTTTIPPLTPPPPPIDLPDEAIVPSLPGFNTPSSGEPEAPLETPEGEAVALLRPKKDNGGDAVKLLIVSGLGLGALGIGTAGYKYANRSSKYFPA